MSVDDEDPAIVLEGELAAAFAEWSTAAADLEGKHAAWQTARERHAVALARLTRLATEHKR